MYSTMEIHYNANKKIERYYLSSNYHNIVLKLSIISLDIINCFMREQHQILENKNNVTIL